MSRVRRWDPPGPEALCAETTVRVRFQEVDALRVVWHGHYLGYFEDGRQAFGRRFTLTYQDLLALGYVVPLVHVEVDYVAPAKLDDLLRIETRLHPSPKALLQFTYRILRDEDGQLLARGRSIQTFLTSEAEPQLVLSRPEALEAFYARWADALQPTEPVVS